jgi:hypothetical protein
MTKSTREKILATKKTALKKIYVPEWETDIYVKELTVREQAQYEKGAYEAVSEDGKTKLKDDFYLRYLIKAMVEKDGTPIFEDADFDALAEMNAGVLLGIFKQAMTVAPVTKNLEADQPNTSATN